MAISSFLNSILEKIRQAPKWKWFLGLALIFLGVVFLNGLALVPPQHYQRLSENPFVNRTDIAQDNYWQENLLLPATAYFARLNSPVTFNLLCFAILIGGFALFASLAYSRWGAVPAFLLTTLLVTGPFTTTLLSWIGTPDGLSLVLTIPFLFATSVPWLMVFAALGSLNHVAVPMAAVQILLLRWLARDGIKPRHVAGTLIGGGLGYALVRGILILLHIQAWSRFDNYLSRDIGSWMVNMARNLPLTIFSLFNVQWFLLLLLLVLFFKKDKAFYATAAGVLFFNGVLAYFGNDTTRNFSLVSWGILIEMAVHSYRLASAGGEPSPAELLQAFAATGMASLLAPRFFSWDGFIYCSPVFEFPPRLVSWLKSLL